MNILAVDTSSAASAVALVSDGVVRAEVLEGGRSRHGDRLLEHVERVLSVGGSSLKALDLLAVGLGPGSFTGLRVGLSTMKGLAFSCALPLVGIPSLRVLACGLGPGPGLRVPVVLARSDRVYVAAYRPGAGGLEPEPVLGPRDGTPTEIGAALRGVAGREGLRLAGDGLRRDGAALLEALGEPYEVCDPVFDTPRPAYLAAEARARFDAQGPDDLDALEPLYVRPTDVTIRG